MSPDNPTCEACVKEHQGLGKNTPCFICPKPFLDEGNIEAWEIFQLLSSQVRSAGMGGFVGFDYAALPAIFMAKQVPVWEHEVILEKLHLIAEIAGRFINKK